MTPGDDDHRFSGDIPQIYEQYLVPLIFEPYAQDLAARVAERRPKRVLEIAAGTGVLTRSLAAALPPSTAIVATDLNTPMLQQAQRVGTQREVHWEQADAMQLPFSQGEFDLVVCQFGAMFFPDRSGAFAEVWRVLRPGGCLLFNVWDAIDYNTFAACVTAALDAQFPADPPLFLARVPHGYHDKTRIAADLARGGFARHAQIVTLPLPSRADSARHVAIAYCGGTPLRSEIQTRAPGRLAQVIDDVSAAFTARFGSGPIEAPMQARIVWVER